MPTCREIAESLREMKGMSSSKKNQETIEAAMSKLEDNERRIAELEKLLRDIIAAPRDDETLTLVAKGGETVLVKASLARSSSSYFASALDSGLQEAETKRIDFTDVSLSTLRFVASAIQVKDVAIDLVALPSPHDAVVVEEIVTFSLRLLMPWLAKAAVRRALESPDTVMLADLLLLAERRAQREQAVIDLEEFSLWEELSKAVVQHLGHVLSKGGKSEALARLPLDLIKSILGLVKQPEWSEWHELSVAAEGVGKVSSPGMQEGVFLQVCKRTDGGVDACWHVQEDADMRIVIGDEDFVGFKYEIEALSNSEGVAKKTCRECGIIRRGRSWGNRKFLKPGHSRSFLHGDGSYKLRFRVHLTKLHVQCHALLTCIKAHPEAQEEPRLLVSALELLQRSQGLKDLHTMLVEYLAGAFCRLRGKVLSGLRHCDMEAIISHPNLETCLGEFPVLKGILDWAQGPGRLVPSVGAEVRVRDDSTHADWRGAECKVLRKADSLWEIERTGDGAGGTIEVKAEELLCSGQVGMEKLLGYLRFPFIELELLKTKLSKKERALANESAAFVRGVTEAIEVQTGKRKAEELGERAQKRAKYGCSVKIPGIDSGVLAKALLRE